MRILGVRITKYSNSQQGKAAVLRQEEKYEYMRIHDLKKSGGEYLEWRLVVFTVYNRSRSWSIRHRWSLPILLEY